jgi:RNA polymerase sigma-70 factor (ECF subfamily)
MDSNQEKEIVRLVLGGDVDAFARLVDAYKNPILQLAWRMTGSLGDADDLAQEAFVRAFQNLHRYDPERPFFTWLYTVALNGIRNHLKKRRREAQGDAESALQQDPAGDVPAMEDRLDEAREAEILEAALQRLPADQREALVLRFYQGLSLEETSDVLGVSLSAAKMRIYRGLERLREILSRRMPGKGS